MGKVFIEGRMGPSDLGPSDLWGLTISWSEKFGIELDRGSVVLKPEDEVRMSCEAQRRFGEALGCDKVELESWLEVGNEKMEHTPLAPLFDGLAMCD